MDWIGLGYTRQIEQIKKRQEEGSLVVEKLGDTGEWYQKTFVSTPPAALCVTEDNLGFGLQSYWYNCKNYRANLFLEKGRLRLRDITKFDERYEERYLKAGTKTFDAWYDNLPVVDGCLWFSLGKEAGIYCEKEVESVEVYEENGVLCARVKYADGQYGALTFSERGIVIEGEAAWSYKTGAHDEERTTEFYGHTFVNRGLVTIERRGGEFCYLHNGFSYRVTVEGEIADSADGYRLSPTENKVEFSLDL